MGKILRNKEVTLSVTLRVIVIIYIYCCTWAVKDPGHRTVCERRSVPFYRPSGLVQIFH